MISLPASRRMVVQSLVAADHFRGLFGCPSLKFPNSLLVCGTAHSGSTCFVMGPKKNNPSGSAPRKVSDKQTLSSDSALSTAAVRDLPDGSVSISIQAKPSAKESAVVSVSDDAVEVRIAAPPKDGEANSELLRYLAEVLNLKKTVLTLDRGSKSRVKVVTADKTSGMNAAQVMEKFEAATKV